MPRSRVEKERLDRLAGSGKGSGGGLPLPDLFSAFLVELLDNGPAPAERLAAIAADKLEYKVSRVMEVWGSWPGLTDDVLRQMAARGIVRADGDVWELGEKFKTGQRLVVVPKRDGRHAIGVEVYPREEREELERVAHSEREAISMVGNFRAAAPSHVSEIRQSEAQVGQLYPVLVDQHGRILDGAHRKAANPNWREHRITVESEEMALAIGLWANRGKPLPPKTQARITELIGELAGTTQIKRERAKAALVADPSRSNRDIGRQVGCDHKTVNEVRNELEETGEIPQFLADGGRGVTRGSPASSRPVVLTDELQDAVTAAVASGEVSTENQVKERFGLKTAAAKTALRIARDRLRRQESAPAYGSASPLPASGNGATAAAESEPHAHDWGPWVRMRQCAECGEQEIEELIDSI